MGVAGQLWHAYKQDGVLGLLSHLHCGDAFILQRRGDDAGVNAGGEYSVFDVIVGSTVLYGVMCVVDILKNTSKGEVM